jgi:leader peptidase (prepilin peptidase)/N-methyltransferase
VSLLAILYYGYRWDFFIGIDEEKFGLIMNEMIDLYRIFAGILGSLIGSFLNVVIYRLPLKGELVNTRSKCPHCGYTIPWWLNVPILAWVALRGKCQNCHAPIHWRYPLVELLMGAIMYLSFPARLELNDLLQWVFLSSFSAILICHFFIDLQHRLLLDILNIYLFCLVLPFTIVFYQPVHWIAGALMGFGGPYLVSWGFYKWKGKVGLGGGDIKLWAVLGFFLGPFGIIENIFFSCMLGSIIGIGLIAFKRYDRSSGIPFGPFIIVVALLQAYFPGWPNKLGLNIF